MESLAGTQGAGYPVCRVDTLCMLSAIRGGGWEAGMVGLGIWLMGDCSGKHSRLPYFRRMAVMTTLQVRTH